MRELKCTLEKAKGVWSPGSPGRCCWFQIIVVLPLIVELTWLFQRLHTFMWCLEDKLFCGKMPEKNKTRFLALGNLH